MMFSTLQTRVAVLAVLAIATPLSFSINSSINTAADKNPTLAYRGTGRVEAKQAEQTVAYRGTGRAQTTLAGHRGTGRATVATYRGSERGFTTATLA